HMLHPALHHLSTRHSVSGLPHGRRRRWERVAQRNDDARTQAGVLAAKVVLRDTRCEVGLQGDGAEIVAHETADVPLTLQLVLRARVVEIPGGVSHRAELPLAELL